MFQSTAGAARRTVAVAAVTLLALMTALVEAQQAPIRVIASNGVRTFVDVIMPAFERTSGRKVALTYGTTSGLVKSIVAGEGFDVVIASADGITQIAAAGRIVAATRVEIGHSFVGLGVRQGAPRPAIRSAAEMKQALLAAKAVTYAGDGASRPHIDAMIARLGIADVVKAKTILEQGSGRAIGRVTAGEADLLITLVSEILPAPGIELVGPLPTEFSSSVSFAAAVGAAASDPPMARVLIASLVSPASTATLRQKGLER
jgi:molybdate transport system substrate-binding protein